MSARTEGLWMLGRWPLRRKIAPAPTASTTSTVTPSLVLRQRLAKLRATSDRMAALLAEAADREEMARQLAHLVGLPVVESSDLETWQSQFDRLPFAECARRRCALLLDAQGEQQLVLTDPFDADMVAWARSCFGTLVVSLATPATFEAWLAHSEIGLTALAGIAPGCVARAGEAAADADAAVLSLRYMGGDESPAVRYVNSTLYDALKAGASDVHLETDPAGLAIKFRLDGVLTAIRRIESVEVAAMTISRIKVMAQLDIAERRIPQDGRLQISYARRSIDVRVSIMPSIHGEDAVLRILDRQHLAQSLSDLTLANLGFSESMADALRGLCRKPHGMLLVTGPTGSGKTTTLYAAIAETHQSRDKIITIEDPVEYQLPGVLQIPVNERKGLSFAVGLRSILRHDPDKILVGEIRDAETAQIAVQSALTGHLVFTTVHANTAFDVVGRFEQFGIDAYTFASAINGVLAQRLVRKVCSHCAEPAPAEDAKALQEAVLAGGVPIQAPLRLMQARGCSRCRGAGYSGRLAIAELLPLTPALKELVAARAPLTQIHAKAQQSGWRTLRQVALEAAWTGQTTMDEVDRVAA